MGNIKIRKIIPILFSTALLTTAGFFVALAVMPQKIAATPTASPVKSHDDSSLLGTGSLPKVIKLSDGEQSKTVESPAVKATFGFNAIAPHFKETPGDKGYEAHRHVKIRISKDGHTWGGWTTVDTDGPLRDSDPHPGEQFPETPIFGDGAYYQYSVTLERPAPNAKASEISDFVVTYIDSRENAAQKISRVMQNALRPAKALADSQQGPNVVSRAQWGSPDPYGEAFRGTDLEWPPSYAPVTQVFIHHTVNSNYSSDFSSVVRGIWQFQTYTRGWGDIGYNYLVDGNGTIYEGRFGGNNVVGAQALGYNRGSMGVALIGCFQANDPTCLSLNGGNVGPNWPMLSSLYNLLGYKMKGYEIDPYATHTICGSVDVNYACKTVNTIAGHRDVNDTSCPGSLTYDQLASIRDGANSRKLNLFPYAAKQLSYNVIDTIDGQKQVTLQFKNTGTATWSRTSPRFFLKTANPDDRTSVFQGDDWITSQHAALLNEASVPPGGTGTFTFDMNGTNAITNKMYYEGFRLVAEGVTDLKDTFTVMTQAPTIDYSVSSLTYGSGSSLMSPGQAQTMTLVVTNEGTATWNNTTNPMRLATWPADRSSPFYHSSWLSPSRMATMQQASVAPGQTATFTFTVQAPSQIGEYGEGFNLVAENRAWANDIGSSMYFRVANPYQWSPVSLTKSLGGGSMNPGDTQTVTVVARNMGAATWTNSGGTPVRLGTWTPGRISATQDPSWLSPVRPTTMQEASVAPGGTGTFSFTIRAPRPGDFVEPINLVAENSAWFNDVGLQYAIHVNGYYAWQPQSLSYSPQNSTLSAGSTVSLTLKALNIGNTTWHNNGDFPVRLATVAPLNRGSIYEYSTWFSSIRPATLSESSVSPGSVGTFVFTARVPYVPGEYRERFSLVAENLMWLNDPGWSVYIRSY